MVTREVDMLEQVIVAELPRWITVHPELRAQLQAALAEESPDVLPRMTYEEFLAWADEDTLAEWVDGEVVMTSPASVRHQLIGDFLLKVLGTYVEGRDLGMVLSAPFQMKLEHGREPDLLFLVQAHLGRLRETYLDGPADLVVEIVSPESAERDRGAKFYEYARGGVPEYWLLDPEMERAEFYHLDTRGHYQWAAPDAEGIYHSLVLSGFWLRVEWLWQEPLPLVEDVLLEIGGEVYAQRWLARLRERGFLQ